MTEQEKEDYYNSPETIGIRFSDGQPYIYLSSFQWTDELVCAFAKYIYQVRQKQTIWTKDNIAELSYMDTFKKLHSN